VVERLDPHLEQQMGRVFRPLHLLLLAEALADHLVHGGFDKAGADPLSGAVALTIVGNEALIVCDVRMELLHRFVELPGRPIAGMRRGVESHLDRLHDL